MGKYDRNEKGSKPGSDVKKQPEKDPKIAQKGDDKDRAKDQPSQRQRQPEGQDEWSNPRSGKSQPGERKQAGDDERDTPRKQSR